MEGSLFDEIEFSQGERSSSGTRRPDSHEAFRGATQGPVGRSTARGPSFRGVGERTTRPERLRLSADVIARVRALTERQLSREEVETALRTPIGEAEREEILSLIRWFRRRYPTPADRLAYVHRAYRRWRSPQDAAR